MELLSEYFQKKINTYLKQNNMDAYVYRFQTMLESFLVKKEVKDRIARDFFENKNKGKIHNLKTIYLKKYIVSKNGIIFFSENKKKNT